MDDFKVIESQEEFDKIIKTRIERAKEKAIEDYKESIKDELLGLKNENSSLKEEISTYKESLDSFKGKDDIIKQLEDKISGFERQELKRNIALEYDLPYKLADRIQGEDEEDMRKDAEGLSEYFSKSSQSFEVPLKTYERDEDKESHALRKLLGNLEIEGD